MRGRKNLIAVKERGKDKIKQQENKEKLKEEDGKI